MAEDPPPELQLRPLFATVDDDDMGVLRRDGDVVELDVGGIVKVRISPSRQARGVDQDESTESESETGAVVWDSTVFLARKEVVEGRRILELGAGCGLLGLAWAKRGARVVLTDRPHRIASLEENVELNPGLEECRVEPLDWREANVDFFRNEKFDIVVGADVIYDVALVDPLIETIRKAGAKAVVAVDVSIGRKRAYDAFDHRSRRTFRDVETHDEGRFRVWHLAHPLPTAVLVMGVCGAGKSTIAERLADAVGGLYVDADDLHPPENKAKMSQGLPLTDDDRFGWLTTCATTVLAGLSTSSVVVLACSALKRGYRDRIANLLHHRSRFVCIYLAASPDIIKPRVRDRGGNHFMPVDLVDSQFSTLEPPTHDESAFDLLLHIDAARSPDDILSAVLQSGALFSSSSSSESSVSHD